jgi:hypothetical protein
MLKTHAAPGRALSRKLASESMAAAQGGFSLVIHISIEFFRLLRRRLDGVIRVLCDDLRLPQQPVTHSRRHEGSVYVHTGSGIERAADDHLHSLVR